MLSSVSAVVRGDLDGRRHAPLAVAECCRDEALVECRHHQRGLQDTAGAHRVTEISLQAYHRHALQSGALYGDAFHLVVEQRRRAVCTDAGQPLCVVASQHVLQGAAGTLGFWRGRGEVVSVVGHRARFEPPARGGIFAAPQDDRSRGLTEVQSCALDVEGTAAVGRHRLEGLEAADDERALHFRSTDDDAVALARKQQPRGNDQSRKTGDARIVDNERMTVQTELTIQHVCTRRRRQGLIIIARTERQRLDVTLRGTEYEACPAPVDVRCLAQCLSDRGQRERDKARLSRHHPALRLLIAEQRGLESVGQSPVSAPKTDGGVAAQHGSRFASVVSPNGERMFVDRTSIIPQTLPIASAMPDRTQDDTE